MDGSRSADMGMMRVVRAFTRWSDEHHRLPPRDVLSGFYIPSRDEAMVSIVVPSEIAYMFLVSVLLRRNDVTETLIGEVPAVVFSEHSMNRIPFHGSVDETDEYEVRFTSPLVSSDLVVYAAVLVFQP